jgi:hypothetical protein
MNPLLTLSNEHVGTWRNGPERTMYWILVSAVETHVLNRLLLRERDAAGVGRAVALASLRKSG